MHVRPRDGASLKQCNLPEPESRRDEGSTYLLHPLLRVCSSDTVPNRAGAQQKSRKAQLIDVSKSTAGVTRPLWPGADRRFCTGRQRPISLPSTPDGAGPSPLYPMAVA